MAAALRTSALVALAACSPAGAPDEHDPLAVARAYRVVGNLEAAIPPACYAETGAANTCWVCHTTGVGPNTLDDADLQGAYELAEENPWTNLFVDRAAEVAAIADAEILAWIREDNYTPLRVALAERVDWSGVRPDLDLAAGFDPDGFAADGSSWRAVRYQPFPGFWPDSGSTGDVFVRLPDAFRRAADGTPSRAVYVENLAILEAAIGGAPDLPATYAGAAGDVPVEPLVYPRGAELLHTVRYVDPDAPAGMATRLKELRWMRKEEAPDAWARLRAYEREASEKDEGNPPRYRGDALAGLVNAFGWRLQAFIEDEEGRLRLQTEEEHRSCMGCHQGLGVTVDSTFALARKVPGADGWRPQDLRGLVDRPQLGHARGELATWAARAGLAAYDPIPDRARALALDKAYLAIVREQSFVRGRDATVSPPRVHRRVESGAAAASEIHRDGRLHLAW